MKRLCVLLLVLSVSAIGWSSCGKSSATSPSTSTTTTYTVPLAASNEVPAIIGGAEAGVGGSATITLHTTKDSGTITAATVDFKVSVTGVPAGSTLTAAHVHQGGAGGAGAVVVSTGLSSGSVSISGGAGSFQQTGVNVPADVAQGILNTSANYYFNIHSALNPDGVARGQFGAGVSSGGGGGTPY